MRVPLRRRAVCEFQGFVHAVRPALALPIAIAVGVVACLFARRRSSDHPRSAFDIMDIGAAA